MTGGHQLPPLPFLPLSRLPHQGPLSQCCSLEAAEPCRESLWGWQGMFCLRLAEPNLWGTRPTQTSARGYIKEAKNSCRKQASGCQNRSEERDGGERLSQESTPSRFNQTHTPTSSRKDVHTPFLPLKWLQNSLTAYLILRTTKKSTCLPETLPVRLSVAKKEVSLNLLKT